MHAPITSELNLPLFTCFSTQMTTTTTMNTFQMSVHTLVGQESVFHNMRNPAHSLRTSFIPPGTCRIRQRHPKLLSTHGAPPLTRRRSITCHGRDGCWSRGYGQLCKVMRWFLRHQLHTRTRRQVTGCSYPASIYSCFCTTSLMIELSSRYPA